MGDDVGQCLVEALVEVANLFCGNAVFESGLFQPGRRAAYFGGIGTDRQFGNRIVSGCSHPNSGERRLAGRGGIGKHGQHGVDAGGLENLGHRGILSDEKHHAPAPLLLRLGIGDQ